MSTTWLVIAAAGACSRNAPVSLIDTGAGAADTSVADTTAFECKHPTVSSNCADGLCRIPAGCFVMGSPVTEWQRARDNEDELPVSLTHAFFIGQHEVTRGEWKAIGLPAPAAPGPDAGTSADEPSTCFDDDCPIVKVSWFDALEYANRLSEQHSPPLPKCYSLRDCHGEVGNDLDCAGADPVGGSIYDCKGFRLPTEAEWEYATRAGTKTAFYAGPITPVEPASGCGFDGVLDSIGWYCYNSGNSTHRVMQKKPNAWGLHDTSGNAMEWVNDAYDPFGYGTTPARDPFPTFPIKAGYVERVARGGKANRWSSLCRSAMRFPYTYYSRIWTLGIRIARTE